MKALLTGASGFLGSHLAVELKSVYNISRLSRSLTSEISCDLSQEVPKLEKYNLVVHTAGKAHSNPKNKKEEDDFFQVNTQGTNNLLNGMEKFPPEVLVFISTVAVYGLEKGENISENSVLHGGSAYADSKIEAEALIQKWCTQRKVNAIILRLPLISGNNPPGNLRAMANAIKRGYYFRIGKAEARRSMVSADDVGKLIAYGNLKEGVYNLTDGINPSIAETEDYLGRLFNKRIKRLPKSLISLIATFGDFIPRFPINTNRLNKLTNTLTFSDELARRDLGWKPEAALEKLKFED